MTSPVRTLPSALSLPHAQSVLERLLENLSRVVQGKEPQLKLAVTCLAAGGHLLLEDVPGVGKTTLAEAVARSCELNFARVQFTADLMPADVVGVQIFQADKGTFQFRPGPLFHQLVLADELNRAPPRTQSALLEAMAQDQVTVDGTTHFLPKPFTVIATQNPVDLTGTYPLPDSQLDRFLMRISLGHPSAEVEARLLTTRGTGSPLLSIGAVTRPEELLAVRERAAAARVDPSIAQYAVALIHRTRTHPDIERGASTRAALALMAAAKAQALWDGRDFVTPGDIQAVLVSTLAHRLMLRTAVSGTFSRDEAGHLLEELSRQVAPPR